MAKAVTLTMECRNCQYWSQFGKNTLMGECRAHAPAPSAHLQPGHAQWPITRQDAWCGEFELTETA